MPPLPAHCRIVVSESTGLPSSNLLEMLPMRMEVEHQGQLTTAFIGHPVDLAAFLGVLQMFVDLGLPVVAVDYGQGVAEQPPANTDPD